MENLAGNLKKLEEGRRKDGGGTDAGRGEGGRRRDGRKKGEWRRNGGRQGEWSADVGEMRIKNEEGEGRMM